MEQIKVKRGFENMINLNNKYNTVEESKNILAEELSKLINKDDNLNKEVIKYNGFELVNLGGKIVKEEARGIMYFEYTFSNVQANISTYIIVKDRYIKTKDKLIMKSIESIEIN
jgi:hypothetical protein